MAYLRINANTSSELLYNNSEEFDLHLKQFYFPDITRNERIFKTDHLKYKEIDYKVNMIIVTEIGNNTINFGKIKQIFFKGEEIYLLLQPLSQLYFDDHIHAYRVDPSSICIIKKTTLLLNISPCTLNNRGELLFVVTKYKI